VHNFDNATVEDAMERLEKTRGELLNLVMDKTEDKGSCRNVLEECSTIPKRCSRGWNGMPKQTKMVVVGSVFCAIITIAIVILAVAVSSGGDGRPIPSGTNVNGSNKTNETNETMNMTAGQMNLCESYIPQSITFVCMMLVCCVCSFVAIVKTRPEIQVITRSLALWTCTLSILSFIMSIILIALSQCRPNEYWNIFGGLMLAACVLGACCNVGICYEGNGWAVETSVQQQIKPDHYNSDDSDFEKAVIDLTELD
jgi:hypothetical protein